MQTYIIAVTIITLTLFVIKTLQTIQWLGTETGRKILHLIAVLTCGYVIYVDENRATLGYIFLAFTGILAYIAHKNVLLPNERKSFGIALFPLAFAVLMWSPLSVESIVFGILTLAISDALAGIIGLHWAKQKIIFLYEAKSWLGFGVFYISTLIIGYFFVGFQSSLFILALVPALSELFSYRGSDNFTVPIVASIWLEILKTKTFSIGEVILFSLIIVILLIVNNKKWLTAPGTTAAVLLATLIIFGVGSYYLIPIGIFFIAGSLSSKLTSKSKESNGRTAIQVFANGGVATLSLILFRLTGDTLFELGYFLSICISLSDTMSSDLGTYFGQNTYDIISRKPIKIGLSGGISFAGTIAGIIAAILFGVTCYLFLNLTLSSLLLIIISGIFGMLLDSVLGSIFQAKYIDQNDISEVKNNSNKLIKGYDWMTNNAVNLITNIITTSMFLLIIYFTRILQY